MATYNELLRQYKGLTSAAAKRRFLKDHPNFADRLERDDGPPERITGSVGGSLPVTAPPPVKPTSPAGGAQDAIGSVLNPPQITQDDDGNVTITPPKPTPGVSPPAPGKDPNDPCPPGYHLDATLGVCVFDATDTKDDPCPDGWHLDAATGRCVQDEEEAEDEAGNNDLFTRFSEMLAFWGIENEDSLQVVKNALKFGWDETEFKFNLRKSKGYLSNPLFAANVERARLGQGWMDETEVIAWGERARTLARRYGYDAPSDDYLAAGLLSGLSAAELEHRFQIQDRINLYGAGVKMAAQEMGFEVGDSDLFEIFDPEKDTKEWEDMFRRAQLRGRPLTLGLGIRTEQEARALEMLGVDPEEAFKRYQGVASNSSRFARLGTIEENIRKGLPPDFGSSLGTEENSLLIRGLLFNDPEALARLQDITAREVARFKQGGGAATSGGQAVGLLSGAERQTFG